MLKCLFLDSWRLRHGYSKMPRFFSIASLLLDTEANTFALKERMI